MLDDKKTGIKETTWFKHAQIKINLTASFSGILEMLYGELLKQRAPVA